MSLPLHNVSAFMRSFGAVDVYEVHAVWDKKPQIRKAVLWASKTGCILKNLCIEDAVGHFTSREQT